jgi:hypothetical protein
MSKEEFSFLPRETSIVINVGGQVFETTVEVLTSDPYSVLAACCRHKSPIQPNRDGIYFFDRDWWLFRHILSFLRNGVLPRELDILKELYREASFYRLEKLQRAIEEIPVDQVIHYAPSIYTTHSGLPMTYANSSTTAIANTQRTMLDQGLIVKDDRLSGDSGSSQLKLKSSGTF